MLNIDTIISNYEMRCIWIKHILPLLDNHALLSLRTCSSKWFRYVTIGEKCINFVQRLPEECDSLYKVRTHTRLKKTHPSNFRLC